MSTTYSATTKDSTKDSTGTKDKDSTDTYVRSSDTTETSKTNANKGGKSTTFDNSADKSHDNETSYGFSKDSTNSTSNKSGMTGQHSQQYTSGQSGMDSNTNDQYRRSGQQTQPQMDVQQKLKEVGSLLQKAGHLLQDLQGSSPNDFQSWGRSNGGNYSGPFGGFESQQRGGQSCDQQEHINMTVPCSYGPRQQSSWSMQHPSQCHSRPTGEWSQMESSSRGPQRWNEDREERGNSGRGYANIVGSSRFEDRSEGNRGNVDRYGGFGGPNRPDLAYGQQYGMGSQQSGLGFRGDRDENIRRGGDEMSAYRRGVERF